MEMMSSIPLSPALPHEGGRESSRKRLTPSPLMGDGWGEGVIHA